MAEEEVEIDIIANFHDDDYGHVSAQDTPRKKVRLDVAERWIAEGKALRGNIDMEKKS